MTKSLNQQIRVILESVNRNETYDDIVDNLLQLFKEWALECVGGKFDLSRGTSWEKRFGRLTIIEWEPRTHGRDDDGGSIDFRLALGEKGMKKAISFIRELITSQRQELLDELEQDLKMTMVDSSDRVNLVAWIRERQLSQQPSQEEK